MSARNTHYPSKFWGGKLYSQRLRKREKIGTKIQTSYQSTCELRRNTSQHIREIFDTWPFSSDGLTYNIRYANSPESEDKEMVKIIHEKVKHK